MLSEQNLSEKLEQLSAAASEVGLSMPGEPAWPIEQSRKINAERNLRELLVNAFRTGQLVAVQADDATVERVAKAIMDCRSVMQAGTQWLIETEENRNWYRDLAKAAISALAAKGDVCQPVQTSTLKEEG